uniref:Uncharacterized protein n=1 Tax=Magallana gigas TaxID=29159 RepID=A0A8W8LKB6_MAGGI
MKRRRLELKAERLSKDASQSILEGVTYRSKKGMDDDAADLEDITIVPLKPSPESRIPTNLRYCADCCCLWGKIDQHPFEAKR